MKFPVASTVLFFLATATSVNAKNLRFLGSKDDKVMCNDCPVCPGTVRTVVSTPAPTSPPTPAPTSPPTPVPTSPPTPVPTSPPTNTPTKAPTLPPTPAATTAAPRGEIARTSSEVGGTGGGRTGGGRNGNGNGGGRGIGRRLGEKDNKDKDKDKDNKRSQLAKSKSSDSSGDKDKDDSKDSEDNNTCYCPKLECEGTPKKMEAPPAPDQPNPEWVLGPKASAKGDPHFKTFGHEIYDFHGECDLVLLHNPDFQQGTGMDIHIRTKIEDFWSSIESAAIKIGQHTLEIKADPESDEWLWIDGQVVSQGLEQGKWKMAHLSGYVVRYKEREATVYFQGHMDFVRFKSFKSFIGVEVAWEGSDNYVNAVGLLGSHEDDGLRLGRDGTFIEDVNAFGQEWQVRPDVDGKLFHSYDYAVTEGECIMPPMYTAETAALWEDRKRRLGEAAVDLEAAEKACENIADPEDKEACVYDVLATQDESMASVW